jgi:hypothetical protein
MGEMKRAIAREISGCTWDNFPRFVCSPLKRSMARLSSVRSGSGRRASLVYALEEPDNPRSRQAEQGQPAEHVNKSPIGGLIQQLAVQLQIGRIPGVCRAKMGAEGADLSLQSRLELLAAAGAVVRHLTLMGTAAPGQERSGERDSDRAANVAHQVVKPAANCATQTIRS